jgi:hypothetical protein
MTLDAESKKATAKRSSTVRAEKAAERAEVALMDAVQRTEALEATEALKIMALEVTYFLREVTAQLRASREQPPRPAAETEHAYVLEVALPPEHLDGAEFLVSDPEGKHPPQRRHAHPSGTTTFEVSSPGPYQVTWLRKGTPQQTETLMADRISR